MNNDVVAICCVFHVKQFPFFFFWKICLLSSTTTYPKNQRYRTESGIKGIKIVLV